MDKKARILAVDDELANLKLLKSILSHSDYDVAFAVNGKDAVKRLETEVYDVVLLDIMMPDMDGYRVLDRLRKWDRIWRTRVIVLSALDDMEDKLRAFELGAVDYVTKPFNKGELLSRIEARLSQPTLLETVGVSIKMLTVELGHIKEATQSLSKAPQDTARLLTAAERRISQLLLYYHLKKIDLRLNAVMLQRYFDALCQEVHPTYKVDVHFKAKPDLSIAGDTNLLEKMFRAVFAFTAGRRESNELVVEVFVQADMVLMTLTDMGEEIPASQINALFDPLEIDETGDFAHNLALANAAVIADKHGGSISCVSKALDTVVTVKLPRRQGG